MRPERREHPQLGMEMTMSDYHVSYLRREHARLDSEIQKEAARPYPDELHIARLKKLKLALKDQMEGLCNITGGSRVA
ncbi:hypothetical protein L288_11125 [Sphingobium quisquiliarum P25]|uniref:DUF465 domain-containing protein n=2 Tax=Sphingomonadaceae TaxID=41297 RepID=T0GR95_9SPHN|nr:hypothetical protein L288_11125 [Sphingobium quisquiliarum P25]